MAVYVIKTADMKQRFRVHCQCGALLDYSREDWSHDFGRPGVECPDCGRTAWHDDADPVFGAAPEVTFNGAFGVDRSSGGKPKRKAKHHG